ncbi:MAG TPA: penicillin-binding protein 1A [Burkholderiaceae bacterium]
MRVQNLLRSWSALPPRKKLIRAGLILTGLGGALAIAMVVYALVFIAPNLPGLDTLTDYRPKIPLRIYTADNVLIGEFGEEHRDFVPIAQMPARMKQAVLDIEDTRFYEHGGVDFRGAASAAAADILSLSMKRGASTITMQVARNFLLTRRKTPARKLTEIMLAYKIEAGLKKDQILELYMNQIYLGQRSHGFAGASAIYFGKPLKDLSLAETAMLAGLPQAPATRNPVVNPKAAKQRQEIVLRRMLELGHISQAEFTQAVAEKLKVQSGGQEFATNAEYVAEAVRMEIVAQYNEEAYTRGIKVYTTIRAADQNAAYQALRRNVLQYDQRHGYRGPEARIDLPDEAEAREQAIEDALEQHPASDQLLPAVVLSADAKKVRVQLLSGDEVEIAGEGLRFAARGLADNASDKLRIAPGAVIRVVENKNAGARKGAARWSIVQLPAVSAAFVALNAETGAYQALVGGFDFTMNQFNHVTQAWRQPGSAMKPFVYSAALEKGFAPGTIIQDEPLSLDSNATGGQPWEPRNDDGIFDGPITMRTALAKSKNVAAVRIIQAITPDYAQDYITRFGFEANRNPANLTLALGTGATTPLQLAGAYAVFANGGYRIKPYLISRVLDIQGTVLFDTKGPLAGREEDRVLDARNAYIMDAMMREVVRSGTGAQASRLGRADLAGKTGTTSDAVDGWFAGYGGDTVAVAWMGYDEPKSLGGREFGATLSLPIWIDYMRAVLPRLPQRGRGMPEGVVEAGGDVMYAEYADGAGIRMLGSDGTPDRGAPVAEQAPTEPMPAAIPAQPQEPPPQPPQPVPQTAPNGLPQGARGILSIPIKHV